MWLSLQSIFSSASKNEDLPEADRQAISSINTFVQQHDTPLKLVEYLKLIRQKNTENDRVQNILGAVINKFSPKATAPKSIEDSLEQIASSLTKTHQYQKKLDLNTLTLNKEKEETAPIKKQEYQQKQIPKETTKPSSNTPQEDVHPKNKPPKVKKVIDPDYDPHREDIDFGTDVPSAETVARLQDKVYRIEVEAEDVAWSSMPKLVTENVYDEDKVEQARVSWVNELRRERDLPWLTTDFRLRQTSRDRSLSLRAKQEADHKRSPDAAYYDYPVITQRFAKRGVVFENINRATSTENIWRATHTCTGDYPDKDCTAELIADLSRIFDYFASEESYNGVHWRTMIQPNFAVVWVSFAVDADDDKVYAVMHYGTELID